MAMMQPVLRRLTLAVSAAFLLTAGAAAHAQSDDLVMAFVNMQQVIEQSPQSQAVMRELTEEFQPRQRDLQQRQTALQQKQETYQRDAPVMGEQERVALEREIRDGQRELQRMTQQLTEDINIRRNEELNALYSELLQIVQSYADEEGIDIIFGDAIYVSEEADITAEVIRAIQDAG